VTSGISGIRIYCGADEAQSVLDDVILCQITRQARSDALMSRIGWLPGNPIFRSNRHHDCMGVDAMMIP